MTSLPPPIPSPPVSPSNDQSNFAGPLRYDRLTIASLVCGLFAPAFTFLLVLSAPSPLKRFAILIIITPPVATVLGIVALIRIKTLPERLKGRDMALVGMILGAVQIAFIAFILLGLSGMSLMS